MLNCCFGFLCGGYRGVGRLPETIESLPNRRGQCSVCKNTSNHLTKMDSRNVCIPCISVLNRQARIIVVDNDLQGVTEVYGDVLKAKCCEESRSQKLRTSLNNTFKHINWERTNKYEFNYLLAICLDVSVADDIIDTSIKYLRPFIAQGNYNKKILEQKLAKFEIDKQCCLKILNGHTDYDRWSRERHDELNGTVPEVPTIYYLAQIQPRDRWDRILEAVLGKEDSHKICKQIRRDFPGQLRIQQIEMWKSVLDRFYLNSWNQVKNLMEQSKGVTAPVEDRYSDQFWY